MEQVSLQKIELFKAARFSYKIGKPIIEDDEYDALRQYIAQEFPNLPELDQVDEDDDVDYQLLLKHGISTYDIESYVRARGELTSEFSSEESENLMNQESTSIVSYKDFQDVVSAFQQLGEGEYVFTPKVDGIFVSCLYERKDDEGNLVLNLAKSRGSANNSVDVTVTVKYIAKNILDGKAFKSNAVRINYECLMDSSFLDKYDYVTPKSGAAGVIMSVVNRKPQLYHSIRMLAHGCSEGESYSDMYELLSQSSIDSVPFVKVVLSKQDLANSDYISEIVDTVTNTFNKWSEEKNLRLDGVVVKKEDDDLKYQSKTGYKIYKADTFAIKTGVWNKGTFCSAVESITAEQQDSDISYTIRVKPVQVSSTNRTVLRDLTNIRLATLLNQDIKVGDLVLFEYNNETTPKFIRRL